MRRRSMQAMVVKRWGEPFVPEQRPEPKPGTGEAVMRVRADGGRRGVLDARLRGHDDPG
jgi:hypothetical protein